MFDDLRLEVVLRFVDIGGIVDHRCLNILFIIIYIQSILPMLSPLLSSHLYQVVASIKQSPLLSSHLY